MMKLTKAREVVATLTEAASVEFEDDPAWPTAHVTGMGGERVVAREIADWIRQDARRSERGVLVAAPRTQQGIIVKLLQRDHGMRAREYAGSVLVGESIDEALPALARVAAAAAKNPTVRKVAKKAVRAGAKAVAGHVAKKVASRAAGTKKRKSGSPSKGGAGNTNPRESVWDGPGPARRANEPSRTLTYHDRLIDGDLSRQEALRLARAAGYREVVYDSPTGDWLAVESYEDKLDAARRTVVAESGPTGELRRVVQELERHVQSMGRWMAAGRRGGFWREYIALTRTAQRISDTFDTSWPMSEGLVSYRRGGPAIMVDFDDDPVGLGKAMLQIAKRRAEELRQDMPRPGDIAGTKEIHRKYVEMNKRLAAVGHQLIDLGRKWDREYEKAYRKRNPEPANPWA